MNELRFYKGIIIILVVMNLGTLAFLWFGRPRPEPIRNRVPATEFLIHELTLSPIQQDKFGDLRDEQRQKLQLLQEQDRKLHNLFFDALFDPAPDTAAARGLADSIARTRQQMEMVTFEHFLKLRQLLTEEQKVKFHRVFRQALDQVLPPPLPPPPPPPQPLPPEMPPPAHSPR